MLYNIVNEFPNEIIHEEKGPFISLYQPTHRHYPENKQDVIRYKNLIKDVENSLKFKYPEQKMESFIKPFKALEEDDQFWNNTTDGLAILASQDKFVVYKLQRSVEELIVVGEKFHLKPLIRYFQSDDRYLVLCLDRKQFKLYEGNRYGLEEIEIDPDIPMTIEDVLGDGYSKAYLSPGVNLDSNGTAQFKSQGGREDELDKEIVKYFRYVDKFIFSNYSNSMRLPLILVALDENVGIFRNVSHNNYLVDKSIMKDFKTVSLEQLKDGAWEIMQSHYLEKTNKLVERYNLERSRSLASDDLAEVCKAAFENRVDNIMFEADRVIPGSINKDTGELKRGEANSSEIENIVDELAKMLFKNKGEITVLPKERMPSTTGVAATFRY